MKTVLSNSTTTSFRHLRLSKWTIKILSIAFDLIVDSSFRINPYGLVEIVNVIVSYIGEKKEAIEFLEKLKEKVKICDEAVWFCRVSTIISTSFDWLNVTATGITRPNPLGAPPGLRGHKENYRRFERSIGRVGKCNTRSWKIFFACIKLLSAGWSA